MARQTVAYARSVDAGRVHVMAGKADDGLGWLTRVPLCIKAFVFHSPSACLTHVIAERP